MNSDSKEKRAVLKNYNKEAKNGSKVEEIRVSLKSSECLLIAAGAGIGVDSGLPDFRGHEGFGMRIHP